MFLLSVSTFLFSLHSLPALAETVDYKSLSNPTTGDKLPNFSFCGYHASEVALPSISSPVTKTLNPGSGDQTSAIQAALDAVWKAGGGVVLLNAGTYSLGKGLLIHNATTLRGAGMGKTVLTVKDASWDVITMGNQTSSGKAIKTAKITDAYVKAGTGTVHVDDGSGFAVGQNVFVQRDVTSEWIAAEGMNTLIRDGKTQTWIKPGVLIQQPRLIASINNRAISVNIPLTDSLNATLSSPQLVAYTPPTQPSEMGIENLSITVTPTCSGILLSNTTCAFSAITISPWTTDSWLRNLNVTGFNNFITIASNTSRTTLTSITMNRNGATDNGAGYALDISLLGTQTLVYNSQTLGAKDARSYTVATKTLTPGPNAVLNYYSEQATESIQPHERWGHGFLVENATGGQVFFNDRGNAGSGHGWTMNNGVAWNVDVSAVNVSSPPLGQNWCVGCVGTAKTDTWSNTGVFVSKGALVEPRSLFGAQLGDRGFEVGGLGL